MRQIKFRIWSRQNKCFVDNGDSLHCFSNWSIDAFTGEIIDYVGVIGNEGKTYTAAPDPNYYFECVKAVKEKRYIAQQWTGLLDKDNVEIYEGDILLDNTYGQNWIGRVEYLIDGFVLCWSFQQDNERCLGETIPNRIEVIGNILETPELLK